MYKYICNIIYVYVYIHVYLQISSILDLISTYILYILAPYDVQNDTSFLEYLGIPEVLPAPGDL